MLDEADKLLETRLTGGEEESFLESESEEEKGENQLEVEEGDLLLLEAEGDEILQENGDGLLDGPQDLL